MVGVIEAAITYGLGVAFAGHWMSCIGGVLAEGQARRTRNRPEMLTQFHIAHPLALHLAALTGHDVCDGEVRTV